LLLRRLAGAHLNSGAGGGGGGGGSANEALLNLRNSPDPSHWRTQPWRAALLFIKGDGYQDKLSPSKCDLAGVIHVMVRFKGAFEWKNSSVIDQLQRLVDLRNELMHDPETSLPLDEFRDKMALLLRVLRDDVGLRHDTCPQVR